MAAIDRRAAQEAQARKSALLADALVDARKEFERAVAATSDSAIRAAWDDVRRAERLAT